MSLIKQLWLAIIFTVTLVSAGSIVFSIHSSKNYLEQQLQMKNIDNVTSLALSMSQMEKDPTTIELLISAQFDAGHYRSILLVGPDGKKLSERINANSNTEAPDWFVKLVPILVKPGVAEIQNGWKQYGTLTLESDVNFAYDKLWDASRLILIWAIVIAFLACFICGKILRKILTPLDDVIDQAQAIGDHRFIAIQEPKTFEFKAVVSAMNKLSNRIKKTVMEESARLEALRYEINFEPITGLMNHRYFANKMDAAISHEEYFHQGVLVISRLTNLSTIDEHLGYQATNDFLKKIGSALEVACKADSTLFAGRISGTDFAVFSNQPKDAAIIGNHMRHVLSKVSHAEKELLKGQFLTFAAFVSKQDTAEKLIKLVHTAMAEDQDENLDRLRVLGPFDIEKLNNEVRIEWLPSLISAIENKRIKLEQYPVVAAQGTLIHNESPVRLQLAEHGKWFCAGEFINWANKLKLLGRLDELVIETAIELLKQGAAPIGINVSSSVISNVENVQNIVAMVEKNSQIAEKLYFEIPEQGAFDHMIAFKNFCEQLKPLGCKIGIEHFGTKVSRLGELHDVGLNYIKIDVSVIRGIDKNEANKTLLRGMCMIAHSIGVMAIAEGVQNNQEIEALKQIGVDGMTGPGVKFS
jgi:EAL domain-containing protein (putative c-di-GMP-specific phosphodiesterase class I)/GGDEF domain-containing protein